MPVSITSPSSIEQAMDVLIGSDTGLGSPTADRIVSLDHLADAFGRRQRRPEWVWVAERDGHVVAKVAAWGGPDAALPWIVDLIDPGDEPDRVDVVAQVLRHVAAALRGPANAPVEINLHTPVGWKDAPPATLPDVLSAAESAGFRLLVTRRRFTWHAGTPLPPPSDRLRLEPIPAVDDPLAVDTYRRTFEGSLDGHTANSLTTTDASALAVKELAEMADYAGPVDGWRLAYDDTGALVGLVTGSRATRSVIGYVGVVPEQRGHGYAAELLAWMTRWQAAQGAELVIGETDDANVPMGAAFLGTGFVEDGARIDLVA